MGKIVVNKSRCKGCGLCIEFCPSGALCISKETNEKGYHVVEQPDTSLCNGCTLCAIMCPDVALEVYK